MELQIHVISGTSQIMFGIFINCSRYKQYPSYLDTSFARIPPILLKAGIWIPYFSSSCFMALISSSNKEIYNISIYYLLICFFSNNVNKRVLTYKCLLCFWSNSWLKMTDFVNWRIWNKKVKTIVILCDQAFMMIKRWFIMMYNVNITCELNFAIQVFNLRSNAQFKTVQTGKIKQILD